MKGPNSVGTTWYKIGKNIHSVIEWLNKHKPKKKIKHDSIQTHARHAILYVNKIEYNGQIKEHVYQNRQL